MKVYIFKFLILCLFVISSKGLWGDELHIAVASNFKHAMESLKTDFETQSKHQIILSFGSTGKQYAQIIHGAPFDLFFAADQKRPELLEEKGIAVTDSRFTYAVGKLVLWTPQEINFNSADQALLNHEFRFLSIANPRLAPYGLAARDYLQKQKLWTTLNDKIVMGENINQAFTFVQSGNADFGLVAFSQVKDKDGTFWQVPKASYTPIIQQAVILNDTKAAREFIEYIKSDKGLSIIQSQGYDLPSCSAKQTSQP